jgi:2-methylisocitrate lyase-like PEP mutase family enzyme
LTVGSHLSRVAQITAAVDVPVSVDVESGYGLWASRLIEGLLGAGAVRLNIEDTVHGDGKRLRSIRTASSGRWCGRGRPPPVPTSSIRWIAIIRRRCGA